MRRFLLLGTTLLFCHYASCSVYDESLLPSDGPESGGNTGIGGSTGGGGTGGASGGSGGGSGGTSTGGMSTGGGSGGDMTGTGATSATGGNGDGGTGGNGETGGNGNGTGGNGNGGSGGTATGGSGGSGGSGGGSGGTPPTFTYEYTPIATMENGEERIELQGGGYWFTASETSGCISPHGMGDVEPVFLDEPRSLSGYPVTSSAWAMHVTTDGCSGWGSQVGFGLQAGTTMGGLAPYDASDFDGIAFWARADSTERRIRLEVADVYTNPWGGICEEDDNGPCHDNFRASMVTTLTSSWQLYRVRFANMVQGGHGHASPNTSPDTSQLFQVVFSFTQSNHGNVDYWIDDVYFFKEIPDD